MTDVPRPGMGSEHLQYDQLVDNSVSSELSSNRTALALLRTEQASDRNLMAVVRTSLSLISFGFTIFQFFNTLKKNYLGEAISSEAPRRFGIALVALGIILLCMGIYSHIRTVGTLNERRNRLFDLGLIRNIARFKISPVAAIAVALFFIGLLAIVSIIFRMGPF